MQSESINELATALAKAQAKFTHAQKAVKNEFFKSNYADLPAVMDASRAALAENGLCVIQSTTVKDNGDILLITTLAHSSGQWVRGEYLVKPVKADPQSCGSAITYARRYAYCAMVGVAAIDEDDDGNAASQSKNKSADTAEQPIDTEKAVEIDLLITEVKADKAAFLGYFKIDDVRKLKAKDYAVAKSMLQRKAGTA
jgi:hypothetical protein